MKSTPILFSAPMIRAILSGQKTQTRRIVRVDDRPIVDPKPGKFQRGIPSGARNVRLLGYLKCDAPAGSTTVSSRVLCPYGEVGDRLWVRETWALSYGHIRRMLAERTLYRADGEEAPKGWSQPKKWRPSIYLPREASRITLEITGVRAERLQSITEEDAKAEGLPLEGQQPATINGKPGSVCFFEARPAFAYGWDTINRKRASWASNPWVWCVSFKRIPQ